MKQPKHQTKTEPADSPDETLAVNALRLYVDSRRVYLTGLNEGIRVAIDCLDDYRSCAFSE
jgi:hypothetical protein